MSAGLVLTAPSDGRLQPRHCLQGSSSTVTKPSLKRVSRGQRRPRPFLLLDKTARTLQLASLPACTRQAGTAVRDPKHRYSLSRMPRATLRSGQTHQRCVALPLGCEPMLRCSLSRMPRATWQGGQPHQRCVALPLGCELTQLVHGAEDNLAAWL